MAFRQALRALAPGLSLRLNAAPAGLRSLSSVAATQLAEPPLEIRNFLHDEEIRVPLDEDLRQQAGSLSEVGSSEQPATTLRSRGSSPESHQHEVGSNTAHLERDGEESWDLGGDASVSGQPLGASIPISSDAIKEAFTGNHQIRGEPPQQTAYLTSRHKKPPGSDPQFFPERRHRSFERYATPGRRQQSLDQQWHDHRGEGSAARENNSFPRGGVRRRSEEDPSFVHALPFDTNLRVESMITDISRMSPQTIFSYLTANRRTLMDKTMFFVISRLARRGDCQRAYDVLSWFRRQESYVPNPVLYHSCIYPLEPEQYYLGWKYYMFMKQDGCGASPTAYTQLLRLAAQSNAFWRAFDIMQDMRKHVPGRPDVRDFNNLMGSLLRSRRPIPCEKVFLKMNVAEDNFGIQPDVVSYNTLMSCYAREGHYRKVEALLQEMQQSHIEPDEYTCSTVVQAYGKANLLPKAVRAFEDMKAAGYRPNVIVYNSLLTTLSKALMPKYGAEVVKFVEKYVNMMIADGYQPDSSTQKALMLAYSKAGQFEKAEAIIESIHKAGQKVRPLLWHAYISGFAEAGMVEDTIKTISRFCQEGYQPGFVVRNSMMTAYAKAGDLEKAEEELRHMQADKVELMQAACNAMLGAYAKAGEIDKIAPFFKMMEEYNVPASTVTYKVLIQAYGNAGQFDMVDELMAFIREFHHVKLIAFNQLVKTYARAAKIDQMEEAFEIIKYRSLKPGKVIISEMLGAYERAGMVEKAAEFRELLRQLQEQATDEYYGGFSEEAVAEAEAELEAKAEVEDGEGADQRKSSAYNDPAG